MSSGYTSYLVFGESKVFYLKMKGDYHRYLVEFKHLEEHKNYPRIIVHSSSHRKRSSGSIAEEDVGKRNHIASVLENGMEMSQNNCCNSHMSKMCQAQGLQFGEHLINNTFKQNPVLYNAIGSSGERENSLPLSATKSSLVHHSSSPTGVLS